VSDHLALTLARSIRAERARAGLSQAQLAHRLGWSQQVQASIETGGRRLYAHELPDICRALGVPLATLLIGALPDDLEALGVKA
jgi:transcriptional regulator with XRE-family HTH domain